MKMTVLTIGFLTCALCFASCQKEELEFSSGDIEIKVTTGENWLHDYPLFLGIKKKNPPQFAIWIEDTCGNYLSTIFATYKIATEGWQNNQGNRRKEALPYWCYQRGVVYSDGLLLPTKENPLDDGITGATPTSDKTIKISPGTLDTPFVVKAEFNHSTDFNDSYPKNADKNDDNYSGGKEGSGQPAIIYSATISAQTEKTTLQLIGHSSPDGSDGNIYTDISGLTSAKKIVKAITVTVK